MIETTVFIIDNSLYSQNQDYLPNRYQAQTNTINHILAHSSEIHKFGAVPIGQPTPNYILTPTENRMDIREFLNNLRLSDKLEMASNIIITERFLRKMTGEKRIILFLGTNLDDIELQNVITALRETDQESTTISIFLFGEAIDTHVFFDHELGARNTTAFCIDPNTDFKNFVYDILDLGDENGEMDPQLAMALRLSAEEAAQREQQNK